MIDSVRQNSYKLADINKPGSLTCLVSGLAWVSGMCNPSYSCTINEGNNFESVYVIAHEMGHK